MKKAIFPNERHHDFTSGNCEGKDFVFRPYKREGKDADPYGLICEKCILHETDIDKRMAGCGDANKCLKDYHHGISGFYIAKE